MAQGRGLGVKQPDVEQESRPTRQEPLLGYREKIARVAYELFERRGRTHGNDQGDWFEAERIVRQRGRDGTTR
jgi:hypothetical protein